MPGEPGAGVQIRKRIDPKAPVAWHELDKLSELVEIDYRGTDAGVAAYVAERTTIKSLGWTAHGQARVDLSKSRLTTLGVDTSGPLDLLLPPTLKTLRLISARHLPKLTLKTDDDGARLALSVWDPKSKVPFFPGVAALRSLNVGGTADVDLAPFARYTQLAELHVHGVDTGANVAKLATLAKLPALERVELWNVYHTDFASLPPPPKLPSLTAFAIDGIRAADAKRVQALFAGFKGLAIRRVRSDAWLKKNADNPFREWDGPLAARAAKAYRTARTAIEAGKDAEPTLASFVAAFNAVEREIDTIMREEIDETFHALAAELRVPAKRATGWFEKWRKF